MIGEKWATIRRFRSRNSFEPSRESGPTPSRPGLIRSRLLAAAKESNRYAVATPAKTSARVPAHTGGNKQAAARLLAVDRKTLDRMIKRHRIEPRKVVGLRPRDNSLQLLSNERHKDSA